MLRKPISCLLKWKQQHYSNLKESVFLKLYSLQNCWCSAAGNNLWDLINMFMFYTINNRTTLYNGTEKTLRCNIRNSKLHVGPNGIIVTSQAVTNCIFHEMEWVGLDWIWKTILSVHLMMATIQYFWQILFIFYPRHFNSRCCYNPGQATSFSKP